MNSVPAPPPHGFLLSKPGFLLSKNWVKLKAIKIHILQIKSLILKEGHPLN